ncbi:hypothetical protein FGG08_001296 [Glutinoglossum americanum]|uniref:Uncharacterized protein n=1 Tax=Glutinoglossum americanum TaxID=1670608 RepID=A0A9P8I773_9PEZI|nr:hypothetical protein FGG08_001296 [Glutinoglossum americanum]
MGHDGWNQSPPSLAADTTTRQDLNGIANSRSQRDGARIPDGQGNGDEFSVGQDPDQIPSLERTGSKVAVAPPSKTSALVAAHNEQMRSHANTPSDFSSEEKKGFAAVARRVGNAMTKFSKFIGPGFMVSVAYIDPGNYSTDVAAGSSYRFKLLFIILMSNLFAIFLQSLCVKLGTVTGMNLAEHCKANLPKWLNIVLYVFAESAIIATDIAEVIGSAIALNLLLKIPLVAGCAITLVDVLVILFFYRPMGPLRNMRYFEFFVIALVLGVVVCFCIQLSFIHDATVGEVFRGYLPSSSIVEANGLYLSCGILGATVMPHSLYLGSGVVKSRVLDFDIQNGNATEQSEDQDSDFPKYKPSLAAIKYCLSYSVAELAICLFSFALFVNSAILIVAGASLSKNNSAEDADLFGIYHLLSRTLSPAAGTLFALALLLSGTSAGIICTIAGQMVSEGQLNWSVAPWVRRLITRAISITPSIIIAAAVGKNGLTAALNASQVALSVILPFVSAPLIYFTCRNRFMTVSTSDSDQDVGMGNSWFTNVLAVLIWLVIVIMNVSLLVLTGLGRI